MNGDWPLWVDAIAFSTAQAPREQRLANGGYFFSQVGLEPDLKRGLQRLKPAFFFRDWQIRGQ